MTGILYAILFLVLPTLLWYIYLQRFHFLKKTLFKVCLAWFVGQYTATLIIYFTAIVLTFFTSFVLIKASIIYFDLLIIGFILLRKECRMFFGTLKQNNFKINYPKIIVIFLCLVISAVIFSPQLAIKKNIIYISPVYWDFNIHFPVIQNFVFGDNFPPQNESFANVPMIYHFFYDLLIAIYSSFGLDLVHAMNFVSIITCFFLLLTIIGTSEELFGSSLTGYIAAALTLTSSSLHFLFYFNKIFYESIYQIIKDTFANSQNAFLFSLDPHHFGYNGTMFNMFYFIAERHLMFATIFILLSIGIINYKHHFTNTLCFVIGILFGLFFTWHLAATIMVGSCLFFVFFFGNDKKKSLLMCLGYAIPFIYYSLFFKSIEMNPHWFYSELNSFPKLNFNFPTSGKVYPLSLLNVVFYYLYALGIKVLLIPLGLVFLYKRTKHLFLIIASLIIPIFILLNTMQIFPLSVYDNHKFVRPLTVVADLVVAYFLVKNLLIYPKRINRLIGLFIFIFYMIFATSSGFIEIIPFINTRPSIAYAVYPSIFINDIQTKTPPKSVFASQYSKELHLAGRKLFLGSSYDEPGATSVNVAGYINDAERSNIQQELFTATTKNQFCSIAGNNGIDFVVFSNDIQHNGFLKDLMHFDTIDENNNLRSVIAVKKSCT